MYDKHQSATFSNLADVTNITRVDSSRQMVLDACSESGKTLYLLLPCGVQSTGGKDTPDLGGMLRGFNRIFACPPPY
jgi:hypothetical protein